MLSYLEISESSLDQYLTTEPETSGFMIGTCPTCQTDHYSDQPFDKIEGFPCSCGTVMCCSECQRCSQCGDHVCPQCSVDVAQAGQQIIVCSACYAVWLDARESGEALEFEVLANPALDHLREVLTECERIALNRRVA